MSLSTMYAAVNNSPVTSLSTGAGASDTELTVADGSVLPVGPNLVTLGDSETAEVVCYQSRSGNVLSGCVRGIGGTSASVWPAGTTAARNFTAYDHDTFRTNILDLDTRMAALPVVPSGGTTGQVLCRLADGTMAWRDFWRLPTDKWWLDETILPTDVMAAYRFSGQATEADALQDLTEHGYLLEKIAAPSFSSAGFAFAGTANQGLTNSTLKSAAGEARTVLFGFCNYTRDTTNSTGGWVPAAFPRLELQGLGGSSGGQRIYNALVRINGSTGYYKAFMDHRGVLGGTLPNDGTVPRLFFDGTAQTTQAWSQSQSTTSNVLFGNGLGELGAFTMTCAAIYNRVLTDEEILAVSTRMGGM